MGYVRQETGGRGRAEPAPLVDPSGAGPMIWVNPVAECKAGKNRMHHDVVGDTAALVALGATLIRARDDVAGCDHDAGLISWDVLVDPEGNEFCCFAPDGE
jgi:hypothetical protein